MYVATVALCSCGGCQSSLLQVGEPLIALLCDHSLAFSSLLVDQRSISPCDVVLATGCISNEEELELALEISRTSRKMIAVGSCAVYGGVCGMGSPEETGDVEADEPGLPRTLERVEPLDSRINIDLYVPGCPPPPNLIFEALKSVLEGYSPLHLDSTVCSDCPRRAERRSVKSFGEHPGAGAKTELCMLSQGYLCMGPVTRGGCRAACTARGAVCIGCRGPSDMVLSSQLHSIYGDMVKYVALSTASKEERAEKRIQALLRYFYTFTRRDPGLKDKVHEKVPGD